MKHLLTRVALSACIAGVCIASASAAELDVYRTFKLGQSVADVRLVTKSSNADLATPHARPALLQELIWRPRYTIGQTLTDDPVREVTFSFIDDRLFSMAVHYDPRLTAGLTDADMVSAQSVSYGAPLAMKARPRRPADEDQFDPTTIARWADGKVTVALNRTERGAYDMLIVSTTDDVRAQAARAAAVAIDKAEAPARDEARRVKAAEEARVDAEKTRTANKAGFKP